ncbi:MAG: hypothetical protein RBU37_13470, partial [Myxococcota bacterium]|nr:hypothetical protein [Myxococcota bacterium]
MSIFRQMQNNLERLDRHHRAQQLGAASTPTRQRDPHSAVFLILLAGLCFGCAKSAPVADRAHSPTPLTPTVITVRGSEHSNALLIDQEHALLPASVLRDAFQVDWRDAQGLWQRCTQVAIDEPLGLGLIRLPQALAHDVHVPMLSPPSAATTLYTVDANGVEREGLVHGVATGRKFGVRFEAAPPTGAPLFWRAPLDHDCEAQASPSCEPPSEWRFAGLLDPRRPLDQRGLGLEALQLEALRQGRSRPFETLQDAWRALPLERVQGTLAERVALEASDEVFNLLTELELAELPASRTLELWLDWKNLDGPTSFELRWVYFDDDDTMQ